MTQFAGLNTLGNAAGFLAAASGGITPTDLNGAFPYGQEYFPADLMTIDVVDPASKVELQIGALEKTFTAIKFMNNVDTQCAFNWSIKRFQLDVVTPTFKLKPIWIQINDVADPTDNIVIEGYIMNRLIGNSINTAFDAAGGGVKMTSPTRAQWELAGGDVDSIQNFITLSMTGDALNAVNGDFLQFQMERHGTDVADDYDKPIYLLGCMFQYKHDFNNVVTWPVIPPP